MEQYMKVLKSFKRMPAVQEQHILKNIEPLPVKAEEFLQKGGKICGHMFFIEKGIVRIFETKGGKEKTICFKKENDFILALKRFDLGKTRPYSIQAVTDLILWDFPEDFIESACNKFDLFNAHFSIIMQKDMEQILALRDLIDAPPSHWFDYLRQTAPDLLHRVPDKYLASFVGVSEKAFAHMKNASSRSDLNIRRTFLK
jgi:signal-transduction protein with cAMP-binding, CBS, and nucleotidyltransferase domain